MAKTFEVRTTVEDDITQVETEGNVSSDGTSIIASRFGTAANGWTENGWYSNSSFSLDGGYVFYFRLIFENDGSGDTSPEAMFGWRKDQSINISVGTRHGFYFQANRADGWQITSDTNQAVSNTNFSGRGYYDFKGEIASDTGYLTLYIRDADDVGGPMVPDSSSWTVAAQHNFDYRSSSGWYFWCNNFDAHNRVSAQQVIVTDNGVIASASATPQGIDDGIKNLIKTAQA